MICKCRCVHHSTLQGLLVMLAFNFDGLVVMLKLTEDTHTLDSRMYTKLESPVISTGGMVNDVSKLIISIFSWSFSFDVVMLELTVYTKLESPVISADGMVNDIIKLIISIFSWSSLRANWPP